MIQKKSNQKLALKYFLKAYSAERACMSLIFVP